MKNKKGQLGNFNWVWIILIILILLSVGLMVYSQLSYPKVVEDKCNEIGLDVFDYSSGNAFIQSSITCINRETNEITKIR